MRLVDSKGRSIELGSQIGRGGEGIVYELADENSLVAKIYHRPLDVKRAEKLSAMLVSGTPEILRFSAWPVSTLHRNGDTVGLLMRKVNSNDKPVHELYTPKTRVREYPNANWIFLLHVASNIARGFAAIHNAGHVIGDVNHGNILVSTQGLAAFIDCDSFQITANGRTYMCDVGVPPYTPPELQNKPFASTPRTPNHDAFGLAVLIFHLVFMGRHPFAGRFSGRGEMPIERAIAEFRFPFGHLAQQMLMSPPPNSLLLTEVPPVLASSFEKAFSRDAITGNPRPTAVQWLSAIDQTRKELTQCSMSRSHFYYSHLLSCPWCAIEGTGALLFAEFTFPASTTTNVEELWRGIASIPPLGSLPPIPTPNNRGLVAVATPEWRAIGNRRRYAVGSGIFAVIVTVLVVLSLKLDGALAATYVLATILIAYFLPRKALRKRTEAQTMVKGVELRYRTLQNKYSEDCDEKPFTLILQELGKFRTDYNTLPVQRQRKLQELERHKYALQLHQFLDRINLHDKIIPGIGPGRKHMLNSFGVVSAADITHKNLSRVPNFGPKLEQKLMNWRSSAESLFRFDPSKGIDKSETEKIEREIQKQRLELEKVIYAGGQRARAVNASILARRKSYLDQMEEVVRQLVQAEANYKAS